MIASERRNLSFQNSNNLLDASFSSYLKNTSTTEESYVLKLTNANPNPNPLIIPTRPQHGFAGKKKIEDGEIGIFGAEKYFKGTIDDQISTPRIPNSRKPQENEEKIQLDAVQSPGKQKTQSSETQSVRSESSWNSRSALLRTSVARNQPQRKDVNKGSNVKSLLASLGCNCNDKNSVQINEGKNGEQRAHGGKEIAKQPLKAGELDGQTKSLSSRWAQEDVQANNLKREDCFSFPVLNSSKEGNNNQVVKLQLKEEGESTTRNSLEVFGSPIMEKGKKSFSLEKKLSKLNWHGVTPRVENIEISGTSQNGIYNNDTESDASSDLFEIESISTNGNSFLPTPGGGVSGSAKPQNCYAPSEASIDWSVATASAADFSLVSDFDETNETAKSSHTMMGKNMKIDKTGSEMQRRGGSSILSGCKSLKSVRVAGDENWMTSEKVINNTRERHLLESITPIIKFQAETKLVTGFDSRRGQHSFDTHSAHASHHLYI